MKNHEDLTYEEKIQIAEAIQEKIHGPKPAPVDLSVLERRIAKLERETQYAEAFGGYLECRTIAMQDEIDDLTERLDRAIGPKHATEPQPGFLRRTWGHISANRATRGGFVMSVMAGLALWIDGPLIIGTHAFQVWTAAAALLWIVGAHINTTQKYGADHE